MTLFQIIFDFCILVFFVTLLFLTISIRKKVKYYKESYASLKELSENFERLIDRCEEEGGKLLSLLEREKGNIASMIEELNKKKKSIGDHISNLERPIDIKYEDAPVREDSVYLQEHLQEKYKEIYKLADEGKTPKQIEEELGLSIGEVELILSLRG